MDSHCPVDLFWFIVRQISLETHPDMVPTEWKASNVLFSLALEMDEIIASVGFHECPDTNIDVSWLDFDEISKAITAVDLPDHIEFTYSKDRVVLIDKKTGLLYQESYPNPMQPEPRIIQLQNIYSIERDLHYASVIPEFTNISFQETEIISDAYIRFAYIEAYCKQLLLEDDIDSFLNVHSEKINAALKSEKHDLLVTLVKRIIDIINAEQFVRDTLVPKYSEYCADHPDKEESICYQAFVEKIKLQYEAFPDSDSLYWAPIIKAIEYGALSFKRILFEDVNEYLSDDIQKPLKKLYEHSIPVLIEDEILKFIWNYLEKETQGKL